MQKRLLLVTAVFFFLWGCEQNERASSKPNSQILLPAKPIAHATRVHDYDVLHYRLDLKIDPEKRVFQGEVRIRFKPTIPDFQALNLDCGDYSVRKVQQGDTTLSFNQEKESLRIGLPAKLKLDQEAEVLITYEGIPSRGIYFVAPDPEHPQKPYQVYTHGECEDIRYFFPCYDFPNDKATTEIFVTVPEKYKTVAVGALADSKKNEPDGTRTDHWKMDVPHSSYLTTLAIGNFSEVKEEWQGIPVLYYADPGEEEALKLSFGKTPKAMQFFSDYIGVKYPYPKYAQVCVHDFMFGGMENISATTQTRQTLHKASSEPITNSDSLMAHELAHQWWGDLLTCKDWSEIWLNEGFATYFEALFREQDRGVDEFRYQMRKEQEQAIAADRGQRRPIVYGVYADPLDIFFSGHVYPGGASRLHMLRYLLGDDKFQKGIQTYATRHREKNVTTEDFRKSLEDASGEKLDWFFNQWFYKAGFPEFKLSYVWDEETSTLRVKVAQTQKAEAQVLAAYRVPIDFEFTFAEAASQKQKFHVTIQERVENFIFRLPAKPLLLRFDPDGWIVKTLREDKSFDYWIYQLQKDESMIGRLEAAKAIHESLEKKEGEDGLDLVLRQRLIDAMLEVFQSEKFYAVRNEILEALASVDSDKVQTVLLASLKEPDARVRKKLVWALGEFKEESKIWSALKTVFETEKNEQVAAEVLGALVQSKYPEAREFLLNAVSKNSDGEVIRSAALNALAELKAPETLSMALQYAAPSAPLGSQATAIRLLGKLGKGSDQAKQALRTALNDPWSRIRTAAVEALAQMGDSEVLAWLKDRHKEETFPSVKRSLERATSEIRSRSKENVGDPTFASYSQRLRAQKHQLQSQKRKIESDISERKSWLSNLDADIADLESEMSNAGLANEKD